MFRAVSLRLVLTLLLGASSAFAAEDPHKLAAAISSRDEAKVRTAIARLAHFADEGVPLLAAALDDKRAWVRIELLVALSRLGDTALPALPALVAHGAALGAPEEATLAYALFDAGKVLGVMERGDAAGLLAYADGMSASDERDVERIAEERVTTMAIAGIGQHDFVALFELVRKLGRGKAASEFTLPRLGATIALGNVLERGSEETLAELLPMVEHSIEAEADDERLAAMVIASAFERQARRIAPALAKRLPAAGATERAIAAAVLAAIKAPCDPYGRELEPLLGDKSDYARVFAAVAIREACGASMQVEDVLVGGLASGDDQARLVALESLNGFGRKPPARCVDGLLKCLDGRNEPLALAALDAVRELGRDAAKAESKVATLTKHKSLRVRAAAHAALARLQ